MRSVRNQAEDPLRLPRRVNFHLCAGVVAASALVALLLVADWGRVAAYASYLLVLTLVD